MVMMVTLERSRTGNDCMKGRCYSSPLVPLSCFPEKLFCRCCTDCDCVVGAVFFGDAVVDEMARVSVMIDLIDG